MVQAQSSLLLLLLYGSSPVLPATAITLWFKPSPPCYCYYSMVQAQSSLLLLLLYASSPVLSAVRTGV